MPASRLRAFLELSIDGAERAASIIRRHPCAWQAVSDGQARSSGSSSRPSGVIRRSPRKEKPAHAAIARYIISHNVYYVLYGTRGALLASCLIPDRCVSFGKPRKPVCHLQHGTPTTGLPGTDPTHALGVSVARPVGRAPVGHGRCWNLAASQDRRCLEYSIQGRDSTIRRGRSHRAINSRN